MRADMRAAFFFGALAITTVVTKLAASGYGVSSVLEVIVHILGLNCLIVTAQNIHYCYFSFTRCPAQINMYSQRNSCT